MRWSGEGELAELWRDAGLGAVRPGQLVVRAGYADFEDLWSPLLTGVGPSGALPASPSTTNVAPRSTTHSAGVSGSARGRSS